MLTLASPKPWSGSGCDEHGLATSVASLIRWVAANLPEATGVGVCAATMATTPYTPSPAGCLPRPTGSGYSPKTSPRPGPTTLRAGATHRTTLATHPADYLTPGSAVDGHVASCRDRWNTTGELVGGVTCADTEGKSTMIISETPPARGTLRSAHAQSSRKRTAIVLAALPLATAFVLAGAPTATAATAFTNNHATSISGLFAAPCGGQKPGVCPASPFVQPN
jgi:hypothetical protein